MILDRASSRERLISILRGDVLDGMVPGHSRHAAKFGFPKIPTDGSGAYRSENTHDIRLYEPGIK
jgi:hypothetical protein